MAEPKPTVETLRTVIADFKERMPEMMEYAELQAQLRYQEFISYQKAGFNVLQAMQMVIASIKV